MTNLYISFDLATPSSGNIVCQQELQALQSLGDEVIQIGHDILNPVRYNLPDSPFLQDYLCLNKLSQLLTQNNLSDIKIAHFYGTPFKSSINYLREKGIITTNTVAAHNRQESIKEFENLGIIYPFEHIKNDFLWNMYFGAGNADVIIVPSNLSKSVLEKDGCRQQIVIIPHGTNIPDPKDIKLINEKEFNVGYLGAAGPDKGLVYLLLTWSQLNYNNSTLIIAGRGTEQLGPFIQKYVTGGKFHLMGYVPNISDFFNNISIYVQPSCTEGWGMEVIEAASHGRPVIVSDGAGAKDYVEDGDNGFIFEKRNIKELSNKINWFKTHDQELYIMSGHNKQMAKKYSWDKIKQKYVELWKSLL